MSALVRPRPERAAKRNLSKEEQEEINFAFDTLARSQQGQRTGQVSQKQLKVALQALGFPVKKADVLELLRRHGEEDNDQINFDTFKMLLTDKLSERSIADDLQRAFQLFDVHGLGRIDHPTLRKLIKSLGMQVDDSEIQDMIKEFAANPSEGITLEEFTAIMTASDD